MTLPSPDLQDPSTHLRACNVFTHLVSENVSVQDVLFPHQAQEPPKGRNWASFL